MITCMPLQQPEMNSKVFSSGAQQQSASTEPARYSCHGYKKVWSRNIRAGVTVRKQLPAVSLEAEARGAYAGCFDASGEDSPDWH